MPNKETSLPPSSQLGALTQRNILEQRHALRMHVLERPDFLKVLEQERSPPRRGERHDFSSAPSIGTFDVATFI